MANSGNQLAQDGNGCRDEWRFAEISSLNLATRTLLNGELWKLARSTWRRGHCRMANCENPLAWLDGEDIAGWRIAETSSLDLTTRTMPDGELWKPARSTWRRGHCGMANCFRWLTWVNDQQSDGWRIAADDLLESMIQQSGRWRIASDDMLKSRIQQSGRWRIASQHTHSGGKCLLYR